MKRESRPEAAHAESTSDSTTIDEEIEAATPIHDRRLSAAIDRAEAQIAASADWRVAAAFRKVRDALLERVYP